MDIVLRVVFYVFLLSLPFYSSKGRPRLHVVGYKICSIGVWCADLLETFVPAWPQAVSLLGTLVMMAHASEFGSCASPWIGPTLGTSVRRSSSQCLSLSDSSLGRNVLARGSGTTQGFVERRVDLGCLEGCRDVTSRLSHRAGVVLLLV